MTDQEALDHLRGKLGSDAELARVLGVKPQVIWNWRDREKISAEMRPAVWAKVNDHGGNLPLDWLLDRARAA